MKNPISSHPGQLEVWKNDSRFKALVCGRRWGKTFLAREKLCHASETKRGLYWYIAPTRLHAKELLWNELKERFNALKWRFKSDETALSIQRLATKTKIVLKSAERFDRLRGAGLNGVIFDEFADIKKEAWTEAVRPALSDKRGWAWFIGSPKGFNHFHDIYQNAKVDNSWSAFTFKTIDSPFFQTDEGKKEIEDARKDLDERTFNQEYLASFETFSGRVCYAFDRDKNHCDTEYRVGEHVYVGMDFNVLPMSACCFHHSNGRLYQFAELSLNTSSTEEMCRELRNKYPRSKITVCPDATGRNRHTSASRTDFEIIREFGFDLDVDRTNPKRVDRWAAQNRAFERELVFINTIKCPKTTKDLETLCYKEDTCEPDLKGITHGHLFDANGYAIFRHFPIITKRKSTMIQL